eukprot:jgi/Bigna1/85006/estExt_fgenesh1_pg.C_10584
MPSEDEEIRQILGATFHCAFTCDLCKKDEIEGAVYLDCKKNYGVCKACFEKSESDEKEGLKECKTFGETLVCEFNRFNLNSDGKLPVKDYEKYLKGSTGEVDEMTANFIASLTDLNQDGLICLKEYKEATAGFMKLSGKVKKGPKISNVEVYHSSGVKNFTLGGRRYQTEERLS